MKSSKQRGEDSFGQEGSKGPSFSGKQGKKNIGYLMKGGLRFRKEKRLQQKSGKRRPRGSSTPTIIARKSILKGRKGEERKTLLIFAEIRGSSMQLRCRGAHLPRCRVQKGRF